MIFLTTFLKGGKMKKLQLKRVLLASIFALTASETVLAASGTGTFTMTMQATPIAVTEVDQSSLTLGLKSGVVLAPGTQINAVDFATTFSTDPVSTTVPGCLKVSGDSLANVLITNSTANDTYDYGNNAIAYDVSKDAEISISTVDCPTAEAGTFTTLAGGATTAAQTLNNNGNLFIAWKRTNYVGFKWMPGTLTADIAINATYQ